MQVTSSGSSLADFQQVALSDLSEQTSPVAAKVQAIYCALQESGLLNIEASIIEELVKTAFKMQKIKCGHLSFPENFVQSTCFVTCEVLGHKVIYDKEIKKITFSLSDRLVDFESHIVTCCGIIEALRAEAQSIHNYIVRKKSFFCQRAEQMDLDIYIRPMISGVCRALQFTKTKDIFIHLNRGKQQDAFLGLGLHKKVVKAMNVVTGRFFVSMSFKERDGFLEFSLLKRFQGMDGMVQMHHDVTYPTKDAYDIKQRALVEFYNEGDLFYKLKQEQELFASFFLLRTARKRKAEAIDVVDEAAAGKQAIEQPREGLSLEDKKQIMEDLLKALVSLHTEGYAHCNIKPEHIFLFRKGEGEVLHAVFGGVSLVRNGHNKKPLDRVSPSWVPPELAAKLGSPKKRRCIPSLRMMQKWDVWTLGMTFRFLFSLFSCPWMKGPNKPKTIWRLISESTQWPEPEDKNSPLHLAWMMMQVDPKKRISAQEALHRLPHLKWT